MILDITQNKIFIAALHDANAQEYYRALCMFNRVDTYESKLNRIACCCGMDDVSYAVDFYRRLKSEYYDTHNLYADLFSFGNPTQAVLAFCDADEPTSYRRVDPSKISADKSKLITFFISGDDAPYLDLDYLGDFDKWNDPAYSEKNVYDVSSKRYFDSIRIALEKAYDNRDFDQVQKQGKRLLSLSTYDPQTLEAQIAYCLFAEKYTAGAKYAKRVSELTSGYTQVSVGGALEILSERHSSEPKKVDVMRKLLAMAAEIVQTLTITDLQESVYYAAELIHDDKLAFTFAKHLYPRHTETDLESLKMCASAFLNVGEVELARQCAAELLAAVPGDLFALGLLKYISLFDAKNLEDVPRIKLVPRFRRHFAMPQNFATCAQLDILRVLQGEKTDFDDLLVSLQIVAEYSKTLLFENNVDEFLKVGSLIRMAVRTCPVEDASKFIAVSKDVLAGLCLDCSVAECFLARMLELGCRDKIFIAMPYGGSHRLDLSLLSQNLDAAFIDVFAVAATMEQLKISRFVLDYERVKAALNGQLSDLVMPSYPAETLAGSLNKRNDGERYDLPLARTLSYCLLCLNSPKFARSPLAEVFTEEEKSLYSVVKKFLK